MEAQTLKHRDGRERVVTTAAEKVQAEFDGFAAKAPKAAKAEKAPKAEKASKADKAENLTPAQKRAATLAAKKAAAENAAKPGDGGEQDPAHVDPNA